MHDADLYNEAEVCRRKALSYLGKPEAPFLLRVAREFDRLAQLRCSDNRENSLSA